MDEGVTQLPDRVLDLVLDQLPATPQRRAWWPAWRFTIMNNNIIRFGIAAAAVLLAVILGINFLSGPNVGGETEATPTPSPTPAATPQPLGTGTLEPGMVVATGLGAGESMSVTFTVPEGWEGFAGACVIPRTGTTAPDGMGICFLEVNAGLYSDPCHGYAAGVDVLVGPTVEDLANALTEQAAYEATAPTDVTLGGYSGKRMDLQLPSDVASCDNGEFRPWDGSIYAQGSDNRWHLWILDVEGDRMIILSSDFAGTSAEDLAEQQAIVDSMRIEP